MNILGMNALEWTMVLLAAMGTIWQLYICFRR